MTLVSCERDGIPTYPVQLSDGTIRQQPIKELLDGITTPESRREDSLKEMELIRSRGIKELEFIGIKVSVGSPPGTSDNSQTVGVPKWQLVTATVIGVFFISVLLVLAVFIPEPTAFQNFVFRVVLALAAGALGAIIPGFLNVQYKGLWRAGGAVALFVLVYSVNPPSLITEPPQKVPPAPVSFSPSVPNP